ncbi:MAG: DUF2318 domain-containing protein [Treponema sp.]|nr:DUF2318 domain-containing protein [Treponema sp.]
MNCVKYPLLLTALILIILSSCEKDKTVIKEKQFLIIPVKEITETVKFYPAIVDDIKMEILTVKASDETNRIVFNACERCCETGEGFFEQEESYLICRYCQMRVHIDSIGITSGGCQPIPIPEDEMQIKGDTIRISYNTLSANTQWFTGGDQDSNETLNTGTGIELPLIDDHEE